VERDLILGLARLEFGDSMIGRLTEGTGFQCGKLCEYSTKFPDNWDLFNSIMLSA